MTATKTKKNTGKQITVVLPRSMNEHSDAFLARKVKEMVVEHYNDHIEGAIQTLCQEEGDKLIASVTEVLRPRVREFLKKRVDREAEQILKDTTRDFRLSYEF